jgi:hypothetical protein
MEKGERILQRDRGYRLGQKIQRGKGVYEKLKK